VEARGAITRDARDLDPLDLRAIVAANHTRIHFGRRKTFFLLFPQTRHYFMSVRGTAIERIVVRPGLAGI